MTCYSKDSRRVGTGTCYDSSVESLIRDLTHKLVSVIGARPWFLYEELPAVVSSRYGWEQGKYESALSRSLASDWLCALGEGMGHREMYWKISKIREGIPGMQLEKGRGLRRRGHPKGAFLPPTWLNF